MSIACDELLVRFVEITWLKLKLHVIDKTVCDLSVCCSCWVHPRCSL